LRTLRCRIAPAATAWWLCASFASTATAADRTSLACIQSAEAGETARSNGDLLQARELFSRCSAQDCPTVLRHDCTTWLDETARQTPSIVIGARDAQGHDVLDARATLDGTRTLDSLSGSAIDLNPGPHVVRVERSGSPPVEIQVVLRAGEKNRAILATFAPPPNTAPPPPPPPPPIAPESRGIPVGVFFFGGVGVAALGVFSYFAVRGNHDADNLHSTCAPGCTDSQVSSVRLELREADIALGVGVLAVAAATWIGVRAATRPQSSAWQLVVTPTVGGARAGALVRF
jgi:hypothetical protein